MKKNPNNSAKTFQIAGQEMQKRDTSLGKVENMISPASSALERFYDPSGSGMSAFKKGLLNTKTADATGAFNNAEAAQRQRANLSGFGYSQPIEQAATSNIENARARRLSEIPGEVELESLAPEFQAIGLQNQLAGTELGVGRTYDPEGYYKIGASQAEQEAQRRGGLWRSIAKIGLTAAAPFTGGATLPIAGAF